MTELNVRKIFDDAGAILEGGHYRFTSGLHSSAYVNSDAILSDVTIHSMLCLEIIRHFHSSCAIEPEVVVGPERGGIAMAQWAAHHATILYDRTVRAGYAEKAPDKTFVLTGTYKEIVEGKKVLLVDDISTTGGSIDAVAKAVEKCGGTIVGRAALCDRTNPRVSPWNRPRRSHIFTLLNLSFPTWDPRKEMCPLCKEGMPINTEFGHGK